MQRDFDRECFTVVIVSIECTDAKRNRHNQSEAFVDRAIDNEKGEYIRSSILWNHLIDLFRLFFFFADPRKAFVCVRIIKCIVLYADICVCVITMKDFLGWKHLKIIHKRRD